MSKIKLGAYNTLTVLKVALREGMVIHLVSTLMVDLLERFSCLRGMSLKELK